MRIFENSQGSGLPLAELKRSASLNVSAA